MLPAVEQAELEASIARSDAQRQFQAQARARERGQNTTEAPNASDSDDEPQALEVLTLDQTIQVPFFSQTISPTRRK